MSVQMPLAREIQLYTKLKKNKKKEKHLTGTTDDKFCVFLFFYFLIFIILDRGIGSF